MRPVALSVIIPAYNEENRLGASLRRIVTYLEGRSLPFELVLVDDGSSDGTVRTAISAVRARGCEECLRILENGTNRGKGYSVRRGMLAARGTHALLTDADLSTPIEEIAKLEREMTRGGHQIAFGSRGLMDAQIQKRQSIFRETAGKIFNLAMRTVTGLPYRDTQCGFKLFELESCRVLFRKQRLKSYAFDVEILYLAHKAELAAREVGVIWRHHSESKIHLLKDGLGLLQGLISIRWNDLLGRYDEAERNRTSGSTTERNDS